MALTMQQKLKLINIFCQAYVLLFSFLTLVLFISVTLPMVSDGDHSTLQNLTFLVCFIFFNVWGNYICVRYKSRLSAMKPDNSESISHPLCSPHPIYISPNKSTAASKFPTTASLDIDNNSYQLRNGCCHVNDMWWTTDTITDTLTDKWSTHDTIIDKWGTADTDKWETTDTITDKWTSTDTITDKWSTTDTLTDKWRTTDTLTDKWRTTDTDNWRTTDSWRSADNWRSADTDKWRTIDTDKWRTTDNWRSADTDKWSTTDTDKWSTTDTDKWGTTDTDKWRTTDTDNEYKKCFTFGDTLFESQQGNVEPNDVSNNSIYKQCSAFTYRSSFERHSDDFSQGSVMADSENKSGLTTEAAKESMLVIAGWTKCKDCDVSVPPRAKHCPLCGHCVLKRDHHCFFMGCCVGFHNQRFFIIFCLYATIGGVYSSALTLSYLRGSFEASHTLGCLAYLFPVVLYLWLMGATSGSTVGMVVYLYWTVMTSLVCCYYFCIQIFLVYRGQTKYECLKRIKTYQGTVWKNLISVFGRYWPIGLIIPAPFLGYHHDGVDWSELVNGNKIF